MKCQAAAAAAARGLNVDLENEWQKIPLLVYMFEDNGLERPTDMNDMKGLEPMHVDNMICYSVGCM